MENMWKGGALAMRDTIIRYCLMREDGTPYQVYDNLLAFESGMVCAPDDEVCRVELVECSEDVAVLVGWRWLDEAHVGSTSGEVSEYGCNGSAEPSGFEACGGVAGSRGSGVTLIYPSLVQLDLAFGGSSKPSIEAGIGEVVYLAVLSVEPLGKANRLCG